MINNRGVAILDDNGSTKKVHCDNDVLKQWYMMNYGYNKTTFDARFTRFHGVFHICEKSHLIRECFFEIE